MDIFKLPRDRESSDKYRVDSREGIYERRDFFVFTDNLVFEIVLYKGITPIPLLFGIVLRMHHIQITGGLILHMVHVYGMRMIESGLYGLSYGNNIEVITRGLNPL